MYWYIQAAEMGFGVEVVSFVPDETDILIIKETEKQRKQRF